jgi:hypothetical protein
MIRVHVVCEGQTEEMFVNEMLFPIFQPKGIVLVPALLGKPGHKGGNVTIERIVKDVRLRLLNDTTAYCTLLIDFYGISTKFPGYQQAIRMNQNVTKSKIMISAMVQAIEIEVGSNAMRRFIPYIQMYEFEALLFSDPSDFASALGRPYLSDDLLKIRNKFRSPEEINDSPLTAPSKRIEELYPEFEKPIDGIFGAIEIGIKKIRTECPLFSDWLRHIEKLADGAIK